MADIKVRKVEDMGATDVQSRTALRRAAALTFLDNEQVAVDIAGVTTAKFVQTARKAYRRAGFNFSDTDLREIHNELRSLVVQRGIGRKPPAVH